MIKLKLNELLGDRTHYWLQKVTGVDHSVIGHLETQKSQRIDYSTLDKFWDALDCEPGDLLVKVPRRPQCQDK
jgi:DNA-binding Xre family transcriptional regulator